MSPNLQSSADLVTFTEENLNRKLHFCSVNYFDWIFNKSERVIINPTMRSRWCIFRRSCMEVLYKKTILKKSNISRKSNYGKESCIIKTDSGKGAFHSNFISMPRQGHDTKWIKIFWRRCNGYIQTWKTLKKSEMRTWFLNFF